MLQIREHSESSNANNHHRKQRNCERIEEKRRRMLEAAEEREQNQRLHGMSETRYQEYQEMLKKKTRQKAK